MMCKNPKQCIFFIIELNELLMVSECFIMLNTNMHAESGILDKDVL